MVAMDVMQEDIKKDRLFTLHLECKFKLTGTLELESLCPGRGIERDIQVLNNNSRHNCEQLKISFQKGI